MTFREKQDKKIKEGVIITVGALGLLFSLLGFIVGLTIAILSWKRSGHGLYTAHKSDVKAEEGLTKADIALKEVQELEKKVI